MHMTAFAGRRSRQSDGGVPVVAHTTAGRHAGHLGRAADVRIGFTVTTIHRHWRAAGAHCRFLVHRALHGVCEITRNHELSPLRQSVPEVSVAGVQAIHVSAADPRRECPHSDAYRDGNDRHGCRRHDHQDAAAQALLGGRFEPTWTHLRSPAPAARNSTAMRSIRAYRG